MDLKRNINFQDMHKFEDEDQSLFPFMHEIPLPVEKYRVGIIGATGVVGQMVMKLLRERSFPVDELHIYASSNSEGNWMETPYGTTPVEMLKTRKPPELDFVFLAAGSEVSARWGLRLARKGAFVIDKSSYFRNKAYAPLVVPEVNSDDLKTHRGIFANPNCTTIPVVNVLAPLHQEFGLKRFTAVSFQSVSGSGKHGIEALENELQNPDAEPTVFSHRIADNVIPWIGDCAGSQSGEERKMIYETRRILKIPRLPVRCTSVRVPVRSGHSVALHIDFRKKISRDSVLEVLLNFPGITIIDDPAKSEYPTPLTATGLDDTLVGRIRVDKGRTGLALWVSTDNIRKGAATNAIQIAETIIKQTKHASSKV